MKALAILAAVLIAAQGAAMAFAPQRFAAIELWKYRLIGARPASPGRGTFRFYRLIGIATCAVAAFLFLQFVSE